jgi:hypothetical protein
MKKYNLDWGGGLAAAWGRCGPLIEKIHRIRYAEPIKCRDRKNPGILDSYNFFAGHLF